MRLQCAVRGNRNAAAMKDRIAKSANCSREGDGFRRRSSYALTPLFLGSIQIAARENGNKNQ
jgi:hypothetical protein